MNSNYTGRMSRSLTEAFGPPTSTKIYPMGSDRVKLPRRKMAQATASYLVATAACIGAAVVAVVCK